MYYKIKKNKNPQTYINKEFTNTVNNLNKNKKNKKNNEYINYNSHHFARLQAGANPNRYQSS